MPSVLGCATVDLEDLSTDLLGTVGTTVQPVSYYLISACAGKSV